MICRVPVLYYHRINDTDKRTAVSPDQFRRQMERLAKKGWRALSLSEVLTFLDSGELPSTRSLLLTFDDGYLDNWFHAFPVLRDTGMKAVIFLVTDWIQHTTEPRPPEETASLSRELRTRRNLDQAIGAALDGDFQDFLGQAEIRVMDRSGNIEFASHTRRHRPCFVSGRLERFQLSPSPHWARKLLAGGEQRPGVPLYEWASEVAVRRYEDNPALKQHLVKFMEEQGGAAAVKKRGKEYWTRRLMEEARRKRGRLAEGARENREAARSRILEELRLSRQAVEDFTGKRCLALCWPWGHYSSVSMELARQAGYKLAFTTETGTIGRGDPPYCLPRIRVSRSLGEAALEFILRTLSHSAPSRMARYFNRSREKTF